MHAIHAMHVSNQVVLRVLRHEFFSRDGDTLKMTMEVPLVDALVGFTTSVQHVDGHTVRALRHRACSTWTATR
jgi:DnaJ family protein B protein 11